MGTPQPTKWNVLKALPPAGGIVTFSTTPKDFDAVQIGGETFVFRTDPTGSQGYVYAGTSPLQAANNLAAAANAANAVFFNRPPTQRFWSRNEAVFQTDRHFDGGQEPPSHGLASASSNAGASGSVTFGAPPVGSNW